MMASTTTDMLTGWIQKDAGQFSESIEHTGMFPCAVPLSSVQHVMCLRYTTY
jgi:hypothetical protein